MNRDNRTGIRTETSVNGIQATNASPSWEPASSFRHGRRPQRGGILRLVGCSLTILLILLLTIAGLVWWYEVVPVRRAEKLVADHGPGIGATRAEVEAWLNREGILSWRMRSLNDSGGYPEEKTPSEFGDLAPGVQGEYVVGRAPASHFQSSAGGQVWIYFFFDSDGRLIQHIIKKWNGWL